MSYKITQTSLKWPQIDAAFRYLIDNGTQGPSTNEVRPQTAVFEFGTGRGNSTKKICDYLKDNDMSYTHVFSFDTFQGLGAEAKDVEVFSKYKPGAYKVNSDDPVGDVYRLVDYDLLRIYKCPFDQLHLVVFTSLVGKTLIVHFDADLYQSTIDAFTFLHRNELLTPGTLLAFDEYVSTDGLGGEALAHYEASIKYNWFQSDNIYRSIYYDKDTGQKITQSVWEIL